MPYHGLRPCSNCGAYRNVELVRDCGATAIIQCRKCGKEKRITWSRYIMITDAKKTIFFETKTK